jgi:hypothetical protein
MNGQTGAGPRRRTGLRLVAMAAVAATAVMVAACSGGSNPAGASPSKGLVQQLDVFAQCMRGHGLLNFYLTRRNNSSAANDNTGLDIMGYVAPEVTPSTPHFRTAIKACKHLLPGGGPQPVSREQVQALLKSARCMRAHGFPDYPDPVVSNGGVVEKPLPASIDTSSPQFESAQKACGS